MSESDNRLKAGKRGQTLGEGTPYAMPVPSVMLVGTDEATAKISQATLPALQIRVNTVADAKERIGIARPLVIGVGTAISAGEWRELTELAAAVGGAAIRLDTCILPGDIRDRLLAAWKAAGARRAGSQGA